MSFSLTEPQLVAGTKTVTRRLGWLELKPGDRLHAVDKSMGLRRGERSRILGEIEILGVERERLDAITESDVEREGFPHHTVAGFVAMFCRAMKCAPETIVTRIEFRFSPTEGPPEALEVGRVQKVGGRDS